MSEMQQEPQQGQQERTWGMLCHLTALIGFIGPLIVWAVKKDEFPFVEDQGKESINFQITMLIAWAATFVLSFVGIGVVLGPLVWVFDLVMIIVAAIQANNGVRYRYPVCLRLVK
jgi:uncharacterized Tic20 family protein